VTVATQTVRSSRSAEDEVLRVDDLAVHFPLRGGGTLRAVDGVDLSLHRGQTLGLVGESGCGKSTLVRTILGLQKPTRGAVTHRGRNLSAMSDRQRRSVRSSLQVVFQDPYSSLDPRMTVHELVAEPLRINRRYSRERIHELFDQVGLSRSMEDRKPSEFSGGQRQRIGIARALALDPEVLVLDEPVSALDVSIQAQVVNLLKTLQRELGLSYLFIAHDLSVVRHVSHDVAVMYLGRIVEQGSRRQVFGSPAHPYTRALLSAVPVPDPRRRGQQRVVLSGELPDPANPPSGCRFRTRCPMAREACASLDPHLEPHTPHGATPGHLAACPFTAQT
jgi:peptide/nickel transport system ATP-binding protein/oligopeptide transport system ATP-binding protein